MPGHSRNACVNAYRAASSICWNVAHVYRAILEGLAYALREGKARIEKRSGVAITELRVSRGGSQSDCAMQLMADIFGLPTARPHVYETSGLGAAIDAAVGLGLHHDFATAIGAMTRVGACSSRCRRIATCTSGCIGRSI